MEAADSSKMLLTTNKTKHCHNPVDQTAYFHHHKDTQI